MPVDHDVVGSVGVDVVPIAPNFNRHMERIVLPAAQRVGQEAGRRIGDAMSDAIVRQVAAALPQAIQAGGQAAQRQASRQGSDTGGAFARSLRTKLEAAFKAMPKLNVGLADTGVDAELARLRARMETLSNKRIGIDVDVAAAEAEVRRIDAELQRLGASHPNIAVRADTATARAALAELRAEIAAVDAADVDLSVDVDTTGARSSLMALGIQMAILMAIPLGPVIAAGLGSVVAMATAAGAGFGAFALAAVPAVKGVTEVLKAQTAAQDDAAAAAQRGSAATARAASQAASQALQLAGAQASLATAHRNAERTIVQSNRAIEDAERALAQAGMRAAEQRRQAAENVERAERSLSDAKRDALKAEQELTQAREEAAKELAEQRKELATRLEDSSLDERDAVLRVTEAQQELARVMKDPKATQLQRDRAQLAADEAEHALKRQREEIKELRKDLLKQTKATVDGSDEVKRAQDRVTDAQQKVKDEAKAVADAQKDAARVQVQAAQDLVDAQRRVADAVENSANAQVAAAEAIASAERGVASARMSGVSATSTAITKQQEYERALAKLTPAQRDLFDSIAGPKGIKAAFKEWAASVQPEVLPIFTRGVDSAKASLPGLTPFVLGAAKAIQTLMDKASAELKTPFWVGFKKDLKESVEPAIVGFGVAFGNVIKGIAGVIDAFLPHMDGIASRSDSITEKFAKWGTSLKGSPAFEKFLDYVRDSAPGVGALIGSVLTALITTSQTLSPVSTALMTVVKPLFDAISWLATNVPELVIALWGIWAVNKAVVVGMAAFGAAMLIYNSVVLTAQIVTGGWALALSATGIVPIIRAIVLVVGLLVAAVIYAYNNWDWFRIAVDTAAKGIATAASWMWENVLKPVFEAIWWAIQKVADIAIWLWDVAIGPAFRFIWEAAKILFTIVVVGVLTPIYLAFKALGVIAGWLWKEVLKPVFGWIGGLAVWLWQKAIKPAFSDFVKSMKDIGSAATWMWEKILRPIFGWIADKASWLYEEGIKPAFDGIKNAIKSVADSFGVGRDSIKKAWDQIAGIAKKPVKFIIEKVYNGGIVPMWNKVADLTGVDPLKPMDLKGFARGGILPGQSTWRQGDDQLVPMRRGEGVYVSEAMQNPYERARLHAVNSAAMSGQSLAQFQGGYAEGGIVGWLKDKASDVGDFFSNPLDVFSKARELITDQLKPILTNPWARSVAKMPGKMLTGMKDKALGLLGFDSSGSPVGGGGSWQKPVDVPYGTPFGKPGSMWSSGRHTGLDFPAAIGTAIRAVAGGRVSSTGSTGPYGIHVTVDHGGGLSSLYAHMSQMLTAAGAPVSAGQVIGRVGDTGNVTGPHLHLEARQNGTAIDPMPFLTGGGGGGFTAPAAGAAQAYAKTMLRFYDWGPNQFGPLKKLWDGESGWNYRATNPTSGAYGIPQALPASKMASAGADWRTNPETQIRWGLQYIKDRPDYGTPAAAYAKWLGRSPHWYDDGGYLPPGLNLVANGTGKPEPVFTSAQWDTLRASAGRRSEPPQIGDVHVYVGDRELTDIVDMRVEYREAATVSALTYGRTS
ncbi:peptidoglycan DD-metalloendopeptidase family protein [Streptomyces sp. NPDC017254]|uniref:aggregation-promoting factor C-terminal-like domain-containing protein n=1 Tax=unclassified Streptomyces TaxID=2593676 RepID=UPI00379AE348